MNSNKLANYVHEIRIIKRYFRPIGGDDGRPMPEMRIAFVLHLITLLLIHRSELLEGMDRFVVPFESKYENQ